MGSSSILGQLLSVFCFLLLIKTKVIDGAHSLLSDNSTHARLRAIILSNYTKWQSEGAHSYEFVFEWSCYCSMCFVSEKFIQVSSDSISSVRYWNSNDKKNCEDTQARTSDVKTINQLFEILLNYTDSAYEINVEFHELLGYPTTAFIDPEQRSSDEEFGWQIDCLTIYSRSDIRDYCDVNNSDSSFIWDYVGYALLGLSFVACMTIAIFYQRNKNKQPQNRMVLEKEQKRRYAKMDEDHEHEFNLDEEIEHQ